MIVRVGTLAAVAVLLCAPAAFAQADMSAMQRNAAANQLGVLEYCQAKGDIDGSAIAGQKKVIAMLPPGGSSDDAEKAGRDGTIMSPNGAKYTLDEMAAKGNTTVPGLCKQMASSVNQSTTNNPAMAMTPGAMPSMPSGMTMPSMPKGMTMPSMPGMPAMPKAPSN